ncbi:prefoldin subunit [Anaeramoeba flamelloides]|uniref:Prefoldin subunit 4 n=1 Tax=Anaeramoeba flamelloides TaxID=1746091 RepID=A0AAV7YXS7_9EUKA|nr:prefoldin subunit [Anaeramoeba flamelloides]
MSKKVEEVEVSREDQDCINTFGKLNIRFHELEAQIKNYNTELDNLESSMDEVLILDDVLYKIADSFLAVDAELAEKLIEQKTEKLKKEKEEKKEEINKIEEEMNKLKKTLYKKFGNQINLEN